MKIAAQQAVIKTASVEINTLTIGGKQMTLSVFRQLDQKPLINDDGKLNGIPWGRVNYHPEKCEKFDTHLHIVWQTGNFIYRDFFYKSDYDKGFYGMLESLDLLFIAV